LNGLANILIAALVLTGIYCPTSIGGEQSKWLWAIPGFALLVASLILILSYGMVKPAVACAAAAFAALFLYTMLTPLWTITPGTLLPYTALLVLLCADLSRIPYGPVLRITWTVINAVNLGLSALVVANAGAAKQFLQSYYSAFYHSLVPMMLAQGKPVLTFASHSIASFFFFVCFYLHLRSARQRGSNWSFVAALAYLVLLVLLKSVSAYCLFLGGVALLAIHTGKQHKWKLAAIAAMAVCVAAITPTAKVDQLASDVTTVWSARESGFLGRYQESGVLAANFRYIQENPLRGIGIGFSDSLWYGDSGPVEFLLRGSLPLLLSAYGAFWFFVTKNLRSRRRGLALFAIYCAFEIAYSNLLYLRTLCVLPLVIVYLNGLTPEPAGLFRDPKMASCYE